MLNILVVEDNQVERNNLVRMLRRLKTGIKIFEAATGEQAIKILRQEMIGLFFLDIELPDISGLKIAATIRSMPQYELTYIVFITTHVYYQLEAFKKYHCYDFIEKPYKKEDVAKISERLIKGITKEWDKEQVVRFQIRNCILKIFLKDILFIESQGRNCVIHTKNNQYIIPNISMQKLLERIGASNFMRTHKSYIVNLKNIHLIEKHEKNSWIVHFENYSLVAYISDKYKKDFFNKSCD
ncbi:two component transcriptional regulator, LytTR family [Anaerovirgula multivorans]|uniref:Stage 0 sporulation protein A homolog n=1 Tax=Anaerovirgula multivorans TaxID=312168 RepID=A0A239JLG6_9FIRM|nr:LytTR family DNA-binding domain-containing protein [Anaerovirgula multivorans]SNT06876.1 two component transcriptional regulator, LytTR family [Anaerovirgula multivorans]